MMETGRPSKNGSGSLSEKVAFYENALRDASLQIEEKVQELSLLRRIVDIAGHVYDIDVFYRLFVDIILEETSAMNCSVMLLDPPQDRVVLKVARNRNDDGRFCDNLKGETGSFRIGQGVAGHVARTGQTVLIHDTSRDERFEARETSFRVRSLICAPLVFHDMILGLVNISHPEPDIFNPDIRRLMEIICGFAGSIIGNAQEHIDSQKRFKSMFEGVTFAIIIVDRQTGKIDDCNRFTEKCLGYSKSELARIEHISALVPAECRQDLQRVLDNPEEKDGPKLYELAFLQKDGSMKMCEMNAGTVRYNNQDCIRLVLIDVSEKKRLTEQLFQTEKLRSLGELAGGVAHDFNNVLAAILGRVQLMRMHAAKFVREAPAKNAPGADLKKNLDIIEKAALDGTETVRRIQEFSRGTINRSQYAVVDVSDVIDDALEFTRVRWKDMAESQGKSIRVVRALKRNMTVSGSASELREVFINLINNAADAMPDGGDLELAVFEDAGHVVATVRDTGTGIADDIRDKIFDPFFTTKDVTSTGLGLSVSYGIISRHRGTVEVQDLRGRGTCFRVRFPCCAAKAAVCPEEQPTAESRRARIMIVEDEQSVAETLCDILKFGGHDISCYNNGIDAVECVSRQKFDLVITDLGMPGLSGFEVAGRIKKLQNDLPVILITGWDIQLNQKQLNERGVDFILAKPFALQDVLKSVRQALA